MTLKELLSAVGFNQAPQTTAALQLDPNSPVYAEELPSAIASPSHTFLLAGPPLLYMAVQRSFPLVPVGLLSGLAETSQVPSTSITEFGAGYRQTFSGVPSHSVTLQRVLSVSANLLGAFYAWLTPAPEFALNLPANTRARPTHSVSFTSELLHIPFGLYLLHLTETLDPVHAVYWENCKVTGRGKTTTAGEALIVENCQIVFERDLPATTELVPRVAPTTVAFATEPAASPDAIFIGDAAVANPNSIFGDSNFA